MTSNEHSEPKRNVYDTCDPHYLRELREAAGMDVLVLARTACLSVAQVRQLETSGSDSLFYSDAIKRQAYKRLLMILGAEPPTVDVPEELRDPSKVAQAHLDTLDQIVAMSHQPAMERSSHDWMASALLLLSQHKQALGALSLLLVAVVLFVLSSPDQPAQASVAAAAPPASTAIPPVPAPVVPERVASAAKEMLVPASDVASAPVVAASVATVNTSSCAFSNEVMPQLSSLFAQKETRYVYLVSAVSTEVCVVDANKQATLVQLKAGENRSVYGAAPWQISGAQLQKVQIYFQGSRVSVPEGKYRQFQLIEAPVSR